MEKIFQDEDLMYVLNRCHRIFLSLSANKDIPEEELGHVTELTRLAAAFLKSKIEGKK